MNKGKSLPANKAATPTPSTKTALRILVIDDNETDRVTTISHLGKAWPFEHEMIPETADDGKEALEKLRSIRYALVVLNWKLPDMSGDDVLHAMRENGMRTPVVVISGVHPADIADDIQALGASFLKKDDMDPITLHAAIATSLRLLAHAP